jgi:hypothetical protein
MKPVMKVAMFAKKLWQTDLPNIKHLQEMEPACNRKKSESFAFML